MLSVLVHMGTVVPKATDQAGDARQGDCGGLCLPTASQGNADCYSRVEIMIFIEWNRNRMPWPCCCESSFSFVGIWKRGGESIRPALVLKPTQMPHVQSFPRTRAAGASPLGGMKDVRPEQDPWEAELLPGLCPLPPNIWKQQPSPSILLLLSHHHQHSPLCPSLELFLGAAHKLCHKKHLIAICWG